jgi:hypothetical protein
VALSQEERRKICQENASRSTGPKTPEGKARSSRNALRHGLTAEVLALPGEDPEEIQTLKDLFTSAHQPKTPDECELVEQLTLTTLRLGRLQEAGHALVADQVRYAAANWTHAQETRLHDLKRLLKTEPARAVLELRSFGLGVDWMLSCWVDLMKVLDAEGYWNNPGLLDIALNLTGYSMERLKEEDPEAYLLARMATYASPADASIIHREPLAKCMPPYLVGLRLSPGLDQETARRDLRAFVGRQIAALKERSAIFGELDRQSLAEAPMRARMPVDTKNNRLFIRYLRATETSHEKAIKTLAKLQADRQKVLAPPSTKGLKVSLRNEANPDAPAPTKGVIPRGYVWLGGRVWEYQGEITDIVALHEVSGAPAAMPVDVGVYLGTVAGTPETVV